MKDFSSKIAELGTLRISKQDPIGRYTLNNSNDQRCSGQYPYCSRYMNIQMLINDSGQATIRCRACHRKDTVNYADWRADLASHSKK